MRNIAIIFLAAVAGGVSGWIGANTVYRDALDRITLLTPIAVLDATGPLEKLDIHSTPEQIASVMKQARDKAERLKEAGFIVLKPNAVMAVPEAVNVRIED